MSTVTPKKKMSKETRAVLKARGCLSMLEDMAKKPGFKMSASQKKDYNQAVAVIAKYEEIGYTPKKSSKEVAIGHTPTPKKKSNEIAIGYTPTPKKPPQKTNNDPISSATRRASTSEAASTVTFRSNDTSPVNTRRRASAAKAASTYYPADVCFSPPAKLAARNASGVSIIEQEQEPARKRTRSSTGNVTSGDRVTTTSRVTPLGGRGSVAFKLPGSEAHTPTAGKASYRSDVRIDTPFARKAPPRLDGTETEKFFTPESEHRLPTFSFGKNGELANPQFGDSLASDLEPKTSNSTFNLEPKKINSTSSVDPKKSNRVACAFNILSAVLWASITIVLMNMKPISSTWTLPVIVGLLAFLKEMYVAKVTSAWEEKNYMELATTGAIPALFFGAYMLENAN